MPKKRKPWERVQKPLPPPPDPVEREPKPEPPAPEPVAREPLERIDVDPPIIRRPKPSRATKAVRVVRKPASGAARPRRDRFGNPVPPA